MTGDHQLLVGRDYPGGDAARGAADARAAGLGDDVLVWSSTSHTTVAAPDSITSLEAGDTIHLKDIDADVTTAGDQAFTVVVAFSGAAGELALILVSGTTHFVMDVDGDSLADADILAAGDHTGHTAFVL